MMKVLYEKPDKLEIKGRMVFLNDVSVAFDVINFKQMESVMAETVQIKEELPAEYIFHVKKDGNKKYELYLIEAKRFGKELPKSYGSKSLEKKIRYIQVLSGKAKIIMQGEDETGAHSILRGDMVAGDITICPEDFGYVMVNTGKDELLYAEVRYGEEDIREFKEKRGAAVYLMDYGYEVNGNYVIKRILDIDPKQMLNYYKQNIKDLFKEFKKIKY